MSLDALAQSNVDVEVLTVQLERARQKQAAMARERELREQEAAATAAAQAASMKSNQTNTNSDDLQRQIDELKRQMALQDLELQTAVTIGSSHAADDNDDDNHRGHDTSCKMPQRRSTIKDCHADPNQPPVRPNRHLSAVVPNPEQVAIAAAINREDALVETEQHSLSARLSYTEPVPAKGASEQAKMKHSWEKPNWALPDAVTATDDSIQTDAINHGLKPAYSGYERKVHPKETLELIPGKFVAHQEKIPDPRMVWIVVNLDGSKIGKIAMHLYGNFLPLTDIFLELKGLELKHNSSPHQWYVDDIEPVFFVHQGPVGTFVGPKTACFGVVFEGQEVLQAMNQTIPSGAVVTIKQSHIYPVKKAK